MDEVTIRKVEKINRILKDMGLPVTFSFGSFDLKTYKPSLMLNRGARFESNISCEVDAMNVVRFYFKKYPHQKEASNYKEYAKNQNQIRIWDNYIQALNEVCVIVPRYLN